jgi:MFS family permease
MEVVVNQKAQDTPVLWTNKNFLFLFIATLFSGLGLSLFVFSQSWYVVQVLDLEASLGLIFIASSVPRIIFMVIGGAVADRFSKNKIMFISDFTRGLLAVGLVVWLFVGTISLWSFVTFALVFGILDAFFWPASSSLLPSIVHKDNLTRANSVISMIGQGMFIAGPMIAGFVIALGSYKLVFSVTAILLIIASFLILLIRVNKKAVIDVEVEGEKGKEPSMLQSIKEGLAYAKNTPFIMGLMFFAIFLNFFMIGPLQMGLPLFVKNVLHGTTLDYSYIEGSLAGGMLIGSVIIGILNVNKRRGQVSLLAVMLSGVAFMLFSFTTSLWQSILACGLFGASLSVVNVPVISAMQSFVKEEMIGRVMSLLSMASMGLIPVSLAVTSLILTFNVEINYIMLAGAALSILFALIVYIKVPALRTFD